MSSNQPTLQKATEEQANTEADKNTDIEEGQRNYPNFGELTPYLTEKEQMFFRGLDNHNITEYPELIKKTSRAHPNPLSLSEVIKQLPRAEKGSLKAVNPFVNPDGTIDTEEVSQSDVDLDELSIDIDDVENASRNIPLDDHKVIIDPVRARLNAIDPRIKFWWNLTTDRSGRSYTIINPQEAYWPAYRTLKNNGKDSSVFGWVEKRDYGGNIDMFILFDDHTIPHPTEENAEIFIGLRTGYNFTSSRAFDVELFGYEPVNDVRLYSLGERRSRRHVGDPDDEENERDQGRTPISEWWDEEYDNLLVWTDDFKEFSFSIEELYKYLDIPNSYIENTNSGIGAVQRAEEHSPSDNIYTMWALYYGLSTTLEKKFQGDNHSGTTYKIYADIATNILRDPQRMIIKAKKAHKEEQRDDDKPPVDDAMELFTSEEREAANGDITDINGVSTEDKLNLTQKRDIATKKQQELFEEYNDKTE